MNKLVSAAVLSMSTLVLGGCMFHGGDTQHISHSTLGRELMDLKSSLDQGAITESEYHVLKAELTSDPQRTHGKPIK